MAPGKLHELWVPSAITHLWRVVHRSWTDRNEILHRNVNLNIAQSDLNQQITQYCQHKEKICRRDSHLFSIALLRICSTLDWTEKLGFWKEQNSYFMHPNSSHKRDRNPYTRFSQAIQYKRQELDTNNPSKFSCVAYKNLQTIHTKNPIPKLTCTTQVHGKDPRSQLPNLFLPILLLEGVTTNTSSTAPPHYGPWSAITPNLEIG